MAELRDLFREVGETLDFGEYELDAYLAVLEGGELSPSEVTQRTGVPQTRVYDTVRELEARGLVEIREGRPMKVVAVNPGEALGDLDDAVEDLLGSLSERYAAPAWGAEAASLVRSRRSILRYVAEVVDAADYELVLSVTPDLLDRFEDRLRERRADGVDVTLLVFPASEAPLPGEYDYASVASHAGLRRGVTTPVVAVADGAYSVYATREALADDGYGVIFQQSMLGFLVYGFFSTMLVTTARPVHDAGADRPLPRRYASIRRCISDLRDGDDDYRVTVEGRDVRTGDPRTVEGPVTHTTLDDGGGVACLTVAAPEGEVTVGGRVAALEDVEAHTVVVERA